MSKEIEFLREAIVVLTKKVEMLEKWCNKHEVEGLEYGNEFEERDDKLNHEFADLAKRINLLGEGLINLDERVDAIEGHIII